MMDEIRLQVNERSRAKDKTTSKRRIRVKDNHLVADVFFQITYFESFDLDLEIEPHTIRL
ncbi:CLUMA_CG018654, isoform A [Clunio marinus]|uniref:CLUMA_CG018654, isoform A n=1 Tax=Clunio marinus TaxID=568069 RepID=A0A1J1IYF8_9DIPT|nr:CLUMA_CG018654, isoform A [Clunio marinus]